MHVAVVYNLKRLPHPPQVPEDYYSECDRVETIEAMAGALQALGYEVSLAEAGPTLPQALIESRPDLVFNIAEGFAQASREAQVPALLDLLRIPYTGSGVLTMALALDKAMTKRVLAQVGLPTPQFQLFETPMEPLDPRLVFPLMVKPNREGSAKGITVRSVVHDEARLRQRIREVWQQYQQEVLVEEFIDGRELTVGVLGSGAEARALPILEIDFAPCAPSGEYFYSWRMKEYQGRAEWHLVPRFVCPAPLDVHLTQAIHALAIKAHQTLGCLDFSRIDIRLSQDHLPYVLEVNPLPGLDPSESNLPYMARQAGLDYLDLIKGIVEGALRRAHLAVGPSPERVALEVDEPELIEVRPRPSHEAQTYGTP